MSRADSKVREEMNKHLFQEGDSKLGFLSGIRTALNLTRVSTLEVVHPDPPTYALSAANAGSGITDSVNIDACSTDGTLSDRFTWLGGNPVQASTTYPRYTAVKMDSLHVDNATADGMMEFIYYGGELEMRIHGTGRDAQVYVDGMVVSKLEDQSPSLSVPNDGNIYRVKLTFSEAGTRRIGLRGGTMYGVTHGPTDTVFPTGNSRPRMIGIGDSFTEGTGADAFWLSWFSLLGSALGVDYWQSGSGGTGYLATNGSRGTFRSRIYEDCLDYNPDIVLIAGGINDSGRTPAEMVAEASLLYDEIQDSGAGLIVISPFWKNGTLPTNLSNINDALKAEVEARTGAIYIDVLSPLLWTGTGSATDDGNSYLLVSSDGIHPSPLGHEVIAATVYNQHGGQIDF